MSDSTNAQDIIDIALLAAETKILDESQRFHVVSAPEGAETRVVDLEDLRTKLLEHPRRKTGAYVAHDADGFAGYFNKHADNDSEVWADFPSTRIVGLVNPHGNTEPGHEDHRVSYSVLKTPAWLAWARLDGVFMEQEAFAEHIEDRAIDIVKPSGAEMLELAQNFHATTGGQFKSSKRLSSGESQLEYHVEINATAGKKGQLEIPEKFELALIPFYGAVAYRVIARLRYRIGGGHLSLSYKLERPEELLIEAFGSVVENLSELVKVPVWNGPR